MNQLTLDLYTTPVEPEPKFEQGAGWYQVGLYHYPTKHNIDIGKAEFEETIIYAKNLLSAKQKASKWAREVRKGLNDKYPIENSWTEEKSSNNRYGKYWKKTGKYYSCNPMLFLVPNQIVE